jgi:hypothetical protein
MPHLKCTACKTRVHSPHCPVGGVGELCPSCGSLLEPAGSLDELVGFRVGFPSGAGRDSLDVARWFDDGGDDPWDIAASAALQAPDAR